MNPKQGSHTKYTHRVLTAKQRQDLTYAIYAARSLTGAKGKSVLPDITLTDMPGLSPMQMRTQIDRLGDLENEINEMVTQYEDIIKKYEALKEEKESGTDSLKKVLKNLKDKANYTAEAKKYLLTFQLQLKESVVGIRQMTMRPEEVTVKPGETPPKAGDLFGRIAEKLGKDIAIQVETIFEECRKDIVSVTPAVAALKIVTKTSSIPQSITKAAGLSDMIVGISDWLEGKVNPVAQRILKFVGNIDSWVKGFFVRTKLVEKATKELKESLDTAQAQIEKLIA